MADCSGVWESTINWERKDGEIQDPPLTLSDGEFTIDPHVGTPVFTGHHNDPKGNQTVMENTQCRDTGADTFHLSFHRLDLTTRPPQQIIYTGDGTIDPVTKDMTITRGRVRVPGGPDPGDTGTWEASKPGGGGEEEEEKKDKKNKDRPTQSAGGQ